MDENKYSFENEEYRRTYWHTCSHVLAQAVKRLYPEVKLAIGPAIENGFYYDMDSPFPFTPEIMEKIEAEMRKICKEKLKLERFELPREEAIKFMEEREEPYKVELINDLPEDAHISFYRQGEFVDLCAGPHLDSTGRIKGNAIKLTACNAAYWRGDSSRQTLQRIYGVAFPKKDELDAYLQRLEEAKRRDHRRLGKELGLFMLTEEGPGFPFFLPKGMALPVESEGGAHLVAIVRRVVHADDIVHMAELAQKAHELPLLMQQLLGIWEILKLTSAAFAEIRARSHIFIRHKNAP